MVGVWDFFVINCRGGEGIWGLHQRGVDEQRATSSERGLRVGLQEMATFAEHRAEEAMRQGRASHALQNGCEFLKVG
ncbi:hypothetical protein PVL29_019572 [Vitis rotundifolia]|uniref:Uncharacterized protein n=1 Tax=Vitis rotundifolia TaxID=103349 RepID=A0AA38Z1K8_VITRO|nr:hypothetical protein PVL29_019572 [Vitis rotundifolia]